MSFTRIKVITKEVKEQLKDIWDESVRNCWVCHNPDVEWNFNSSYRVAIRYTDSKETEIEGYVIFYPCDIEGRTYTWIPYAYVRPACRHKGAFKDMLDSIMLHEGFLPVRLGCYTDNVQAERVYRKMRFIPVLTEYEKMP